MALDQPVFSNVKGIYVLYGPTFESQVNLNDFAYWRAISASTLDGVEQEVVLQETIYSHPYEARVNIKERIFSVRFSPVMASNGQRFYGFETFNRLDELKKKLYSGPLRLCFARGLDASPEPVFMYLNCRIETITEVERGIFEAKFIAADPFFYFYDGGLVGGGHGRDVNFDPNAVGAFQETDSMARGTISQQVIITDEDVDNADAGYYAPIPVSYAGSAPSESVYVFRIGSNGGVYRYYRDLTITNNAPYPLRNHPICIDLGNLTAAGLVGDPTNPAATPSAKYWETSHTDHNIKDIRVQTYWGDNMQFFIRDSGNHSGTWHQSVKLWVMFNLLEVGETTTVRVLHGNLNALAADIYPEQSSVRAMFNMYDSDNTTWIYSDFMPLWNFPQTRVYQWTAYIPPHNNITWIGFPHPAFDNLTGGVNVACAGARTQFYAPAQGAGGLQISFPIGVSSIVSTVRISTTDKTPFVIRWQRRNGEWVDSNYGEPGYYADAGSVANATLTAQANAGATTLNISPGTVAFTTAVNVLIKLDDHSVHRSAISAVTGSTITIVTAIPISRYAPNGTRITGYKTLTSQTKSFSSSDYPLTIAAILRGDHPEYNSGDWYFGGLEAVNVTFSSTEKPTVTAWASATEIDLFALTKYQLSGVFGNSGTGEYLYINTITHNINDIVVLDCPNREVWYYAWNSTLNQWDAPVNIIESITFLAVRYYWIHLDPFAANDLTFIHDANSNFRNLDVFMVYPIIYY